MANVQPEAQPLWRLGEYVLEEKPWSNPVPERGLGGEALAEYWRALLERHQQLLGAKMRHEEPGPGLVHYRYELKIEIKTYEAVLALLHAIIAPGAPFLCDAACPHLAVGMTAEQLKRFVDALDMHAAGWRGEVAASKRWGTPEEDLVNQAQVLERCRAELLARGRRGEGQ